MSPVVAYRALDPVQAQLLCEWLAAQGIVARVQNDAVSGAQGELPLGWSMAPQVVVNAADLPRAREWIEAFEEKWRRSLSRQSELAGGERGAFTADWPTCPRCEARRIARCRYCGEAGNAFRLADPVVEGGPQLLVCPGCRDCIEPEYYRRCHQCGFDLGDGVEVAGAEVRPLQPINPRLLLVLALLIAGGLALAGYFLLVFSQP